MSVKIKDIASKANVSLATVSLVLNNKRGVSETTKQKILKIAREMNYELPKSSYTGAQAKGIIKFLKIAKHGHTVNRDHDVFLADYIDGLAHEARENYYNLDIMAFSNKQMSEIIEIVENTHSDGVILLATELSFEDIRSFSRLDCPVIVIDSYYDFLNFDFVDMNNLDSVFQIVENLINNGHREIGFIRSPAEVQNFRLREIGFKKSLKWCGIPYNEDYVFSVDSTFQGAYSDMLNILKRKSKLPTALFSSNDIIAYGCIKALKESGLHIPNDISLIGFDDLPMSSMMDPPLTTMLVNKTRIGRTAMKLLINRLENDPSMPPNKIVIGGELIIRKSVKKIS
ncbi:MAG: LacI family DNA-binding transcriptional regulator [Spirochaetota bacterium]